MIERGCSHPTNRARKHAGCDAARWRRSGWRTLALAVLLTHAHVARAQQQPILALGETMDRPAALSLSVPPGRPDVRISVTSSVARKVTFIAFGRQASLSTFGSSTGERELAPDTPFLLAVRAAPGPVVIVAVAHETRIDERDLYNVPSAFSQLEARALDQFLLAQRVRSPYLSHDLSHAAASLTARLFLTLDPAFIVYATRPMVLTAQSGTWRSQECGFDRGEPLLLLSSSRHAGTGVVGTVLRATGQRCTVGSLASFVTTTRPATLTMPPPVLPEIRQNLNRWADEEFLALAGSNPRVARYQQQKERVQACSEAERKKLDPDGRARGFDVVSYAGGKVGKVESLTRRNDRLIAEKCKQAPLFRERDAIRAALDQTYLVETKRRLSEIAARLTDPSPGALYQ